MAGGGRSAAWSTVRRRRRRRGPGRREEQEEEEEAAAAAAALRRRIREAREKLLLSDFWEATRGSVGRCLRRQREQIRGAASPVREIPGASPGAEPAPGPASHKCVCYGLGNFASCALARFQLAFLLLLLEHAQIPRNHCSVFDPAFSPLEIAVLDDLGVTVLQENEEGKRGVGDEPTLFYMVHCGTALYNNLLWSNWSVEALARTVIVGNSFGGIGERLATRIFLRDYPYVAQILEGTEEVAFPQTPEYTDVFNDTSLHWFPVPKLRELPPRVWLSREEPDYRDCDELEIVRKRRGPAPTDTAASPDGPPVRRGPRPPPPAELRDAPGGGSGGSGGAVPAHRDPTGRETRGDWPKRNPGVPGPAGD
ncbi:SRR1-like protein [Ornithorhynchus anatinus]|uniref:SRR1-like protein n=1 Tax=Ornithorhynchus anatinus TaxID=9258 RepID=UPI0010A80BD7|nr:SRR1-like protein [Ornithorhynchus anatinus]